MVRKGGLNLIFFSQVSAQRWQQPRVPSTQWPEVRSRIEGQPLEIWGVMKRVSHCSGNTQGTQTRDQMFILNSKKKLFFERGRMSIPLD